MLEPTDEPRQQKDKGRNATDLGHKVCSRHTFEFSNMAYTKKQQDALAKASPAQREGMKKLFDSQSRPAPSAIPTPNFMKQPQAPRPKPKPKARPKRNQQPRATNRGPKAPAKRLPSFMPLPDAESPYLVLNLPNVMQFGSGSNGAFLCFSLLRGHADSPFDDGCVTDFIGTAKVDSNLLLSNSISTLRCAIANTPTLTQARQDNDRRVRLHAMSVTIRCVGTSGGLYPVGEVWIGKTYMSDYYDRTDQSESIKNSIIDPLVQSGRLHAFSAVDLLKPVRVDAAVGDISFYKQWNDLQVESLEFPDGYLEPHQGLESIIIWIPAALPAVQYRITVNTTWCVRNSGDVMINSAMRSYQPSKIDAWNAYCTDRKSVV